MADARAKILITAEDRTKAAFDSVARSFGELKTIGASVLGGLGASAALNAIVESGKAAEQSANRLTAAFKLQGTQVGITRAELDDLADSMAAATQFNDNDFKRGEAELLKFGNIYGDVFKRATQLSADLAAFNGGDLVSAFDAVGKALANPIDGMKGLGAATGKLTAADRDHIKTLVEHNQGLEAQTFVLDLLQKKIGGTADLMNSGYTKATEDYAKAWDKVKESLAEIPALKGAVTGTLEGFAAVMNLFSGMVQGSAEPLFGKRIAMYREMLDLQNQIAMTERAGGHLDLTNVDDEGRVTGEIFDLDVLKKKLEETRKLYDELFILPPAQTNKPNLGMTDEQIAFLKGLKQELETAKGGDGIGGKLFKAEDLGVLDKARPIILETNTALTEQAKSVKDAQKAWQDYVAIDQFLQDQRDTTALLKGETRGAAAGGNRAERIQWAESDRMQIAIQRQAMTLSDGAREVFVKNAEAQMLAWQKAYDENYAVTRSFASGFKTTMSEIYEDATNSAAQTHDLFVDAFKGMEDALVAFVKTGKLNFHDLADSIITDLIRINIQRSIEGPLAGALGSAFGSIFGTFTGGGSASAAPGTGASSYGLTSSGGFKIEAPARASGGPVSANQPYWVGDGGEPELFTPSSSGTITPMSKMGGGVHIENLSIGDGASPESVQQAFREIRDLRASVGSMAVNAVASARQRGAAGLR